jgi:predicted ATPase
VAQIGSIIGRGFTYPLLRAVAGMEEPALKAALERLAEADILLVQGLPPESDYRFKHALIQDAAYENLLKSRRQTLHRMVAGTLRDRFPATAATEPEVLAHHFTQAGLDDAAIEWWGKAGDQALRRSAFKEATAHLSKAIEMADKIAAGSKPRGGDRLRLQLSYGNALISARGYGAQETTAAFARARELVTQAEEAADRFSAYYGLWVGAFTRGELVPMQEVVKALLRECENQPTSPEAGIAHRLAGTANWYAGDFEDARAHLEHALEIFDPQRDRDLAFRFGHDVGVAELAYLAMVRWSLGEVERAHQLAEEMVTRAIQTRHIPTVVYGHMHNAIFEFMRRNPSGAAPHVEAFVDLARQHVLPNWLAYGRFFEPWARWHSVGRDGSLTEMRQATALLREQGVVLYTIALETVLAEVEAQEGQLEAANATVDRALTDTERTGHRWFEAETHRIRGEILLKRDLSNTGSAEEAFLTAIAVAQQQKARSFELRAALALAKLYQLTGRAADAHAVLGPASAGFSPTPEFPEVEEAQTLLTGLARTEEVKSAAALRKRQVELQLSLGNALISARGHGALETTAAFARARELAAGIEDPSERFSIYYGLWLGSFVRGELDPMLEISEAARHHAEHHPGSGEAGVAWRIHGLTYWYQGDFATARYYIERALASFDPERDHDLAFRFGQDIGVAFMNYLAWTIWPLGEVDRARQLEEAAIARAHGVGHVATLVYAEFWKGLLEILRDDVGRAAPHAVKTLELAREHGLQMFGALGIALNGWVRAALGEREAGIVEMRQGITAFRDQGLRLLTPPLDSLLATLEAESGAIDAALARTDQALVEVERTGQRWYEAEMHRIRGEILLKRDLADTASAEEAFRSAIAIAQRQKARSFELRAALALATLYKATNRAAEAYAILRPALKGFSPTSEFPEIEEAQTLLATLSP